MKNYHKIMAILLSLQLLWQGLVLAAPSYQINNIRFSQTPAATRIVFDCDKVPEYKINILNNGLRIVISFSNTVNLSKIKTVGLLMFMIIGQFTYGQSDKDKALEKGRAAIELMDNGKINESIKLLEEAQKLDPVKFDYPYELAYANYLNKDYKGAIKIIAIKVEIKLGKISSFESKNIPSLLYVINAIETEIIKNNCNIPTLVL